jgi:hypothetical protein
MKFIRNGPNFYIPPPIYQGIQMIPYNSSMSDPYQHPMQVNSKIPCFGGESNVPDENEFLMSHEEI